MGNVLTRPWRRCLDFKGRSTRREFWLFYLQSILVIIAAGLLAEIAKALGASEAIIGFMTIPFVLIVLFMILAQLAAGVRRIHDHDKTGWFILLGMVPLVGWIFFLIMMLTPGTPGENSYGYDPREGERPSLEEVAGVFS